MFNIGPGELIAISMVALLVLGPQRLPGAVRTVGRVVGELRRISGGFQDELRNAFEESELDDGATARSDRYRPPPPPPDDTTPAVRSAEASDEAPRAIPPGGTSEAGVGTEPTATESVERAGTESGEDHEGAITTDSPDSPGKADGPDSTEKSDDPGGPGKAHSPGGPESRGTADGEQDTETPRASGTAPADS